jgi:tetratricopeptide (TPR) repeat protein
VVAAADADSATVHYEIGQVLVRTAISTGAVASFERALALEPELREGYYGLGLALKRRARHCRRRVRGAASPANDLCSNARAAMARGDLGAASEQLLEALRVDDRNADAHNLLGSFSASRASCPRHSDTSSARRRCSRSRPTRTYNLGVALWYSAAKDRALTELKQSVVLDPACGACYAFLGTVLREGGNLPMAQASLQRAIAVLAPTAAVYVDLGITYLRADSLDRALGQFEAGLNLPAVTAGAGLGRRHRWPSARNRRAPGSGRGAQRAGPDARTQGRGQRRGGRRDPRGHPPASGLRRSAEQPGARAAPGRRRRGSDRCIPRGRAHQPGIRGTPTTTSAPRSRQRMPQRAVRELETAVRLAPASVKALYNLAMAYGVSPAPGPAKQIEYLRKVIELEPAFARGRLALGKALLQDGKPADAVSSCRKRRSSSRTTASRTISSGSHWRGPDAGTKHPRAAEGPRPHRRERSQPERQPRSDGGTRRARERRPAAAEAKFQRAIRLGPASAEAQACSARSSKSRATPGMP